MRALLKLKIRAKYSVFDPVHSRKIGLRREEMFRCFPKLSDSTLPQKPVFQESKLLSFFPADVRNFRSSILWLFLPRHLLNRLGAMTDTTDLQLEDYTSLDGSRPTSRASTFSSDDPHLDPNPSFPSATNCTATWEGSTNNTVDDT